MCQSRIRARFVRGGSISACGAALLLAIAAAGCAKDDYSQSYAYDASRMRAAAAHEQRAPQVEVEDDGLPVQAPPVHRGRPEADDPSEPFSPNYGGQRVQRRAAAMVDDNGVVEGDDQDDGRRQAGRRIASTARY